MTHKKYNFIIEAAESIAYIEVLLIQIGATEVKRNYEQGLCNGISFLLYHPNNQQVFTFIFKVGVEEYFLLLWNQKKRHPNTADSLYTQAYNKVWKTLADWTEVQYNMILHVQATPLQLFLPFMLAPKTSETLFNKVASGQVNYLP